jgi:nicotinamidase/pyrazinamidase
MNSIFLLDVDTQRDFMLRSGAWPVPGGERLIPKLRRLFDFARNNGVSIISSVELHNPGDTEFSAFPPHCLQGTEGQRKIDDTLLPRPMIVENRPIDRNLADMVRKHQQIIIQKQQFDVFTNPVSEKLLRVLPQRAIVCGVTAEHSIRQSCLGLRRLGVKTALVSDAVGSLAGPSADSAFAEMKNAGVDFTTVDALLAALQGG